MVLIARQRILHITDAYAAGVMTAINALAEMQAAAGHEVRLIVLERRGARLNPKFKDSNIEIVSLGEMTFGNLIKLFCTVYIKASEYDFVHFHSSRSGFFGRLILLNRRKLAQVYTPHGFSFLRTDITLWKQKIFFYLEMLMAHLSSAAIVGVSLNEVYLSQKIGAKKAYLLHNSINIPKELYNRDRYKRPNNQFTVAFVGRNTPAKDPAFFLDLAAKCKSQIEFRWIGASIDDLVGVAIPPNLTLCGFQQRDEALHLLAAADALIVTSLWEGLPTNIIESQMLGVIVFMRNTLDIPELIIDEETGFKFELASDFKRILLDPKFHLKAKKIADKAKIQAESEFSSSANIWRWSEVYSIIRDFANE